MRVVVVVQARTASMRFPGKVLLPLAGKPLLERLIERIWAASTPCDVVIATTTDPADDPICRLSLSSGVSCFRGHPTDLLDRHLRAARRAYADVVVKIPANCPLIAPSVIDRVIGHYVRNVRRFDFVTNLYTPSYPDGNNVEVMPFEVLETAWHEAAEEHEREHTTPFIWERPERFRLGSVQWESGLDYSASHRWTMDYPEDYGFISAVYDRLCTPTRPVFSLEDVLALVRDDPEVAALNERDTARKWLPGRPPFPVGEVGGAYFAPAALRIFAAAGQAPASAMMVIPGAR